MARGRLQKLPTSAALTLNLRHTVHMNHLPDRTDEYEKCFIFKKKKKKLHDDPCRPVWEVSFQVSHTYLTPQLHQMQS